jgi:predicted Zn-dependent protease
VTGFDATLFDSHTAQRWPVRVDVDGDHLRVEGDFDLVTLERASVTPDAPVPGVPRVLRLASGGTLETADHAAVEALWPTRSPLIRFAFRLESSWRAALSSVAIIAACVALLIVVVLPQFADEVADHVSPSVEKTMGNHAFESMEGGWLKPTELPPERREALTEAFRQFIAGEPGERDYRIELRKAGTANAFALPGGIVVVTDEMVKLAANDDELLAVLGHEIGHVRGRHALRLVLRQSGVFVLVTALAGDAVGMTILAAALPTMLLEAGYTRQFEAEADEYAFGHLKRHGRSPQAFADVMRRLAKEDGPDDRKERLFRYLSSHPITAERIERAEAAAKN